MFSFFFYESSQGVMFIEARANFWPLAFSDSPRIFNHLYRNYEYKTFYFFDLQTGAN